MRNEGLLAIRRQVQARGYFEKAPGRVVGELTLLVGVAAISVGMFIAVDSVVIKTAALVLLALTKVGVSTNTHTSSHYATSDSRRVNEILTYFGFPFFVGLSATYWWHKHVVVHHPAPNVIGVDDDADLLPFFAVNTTELDGISTLRRLYHRVQWLIIPFAIVGNSFSMQFAGWRHLVRALRDPTRRRRAHWIDLSVLLLHGLVWIVMPMMFFSAADVVLFYLVRGGLYSYALFAAIAPAHFPAEALFVDKSSKNVDVVLL
jgi:Fatty acid desaturase